jgi:hypothetical protein
MKERTYTATVKILVASDNDNEVDREDLIKSLMDCIVLDIDIENGTASLGEDAEHAIAAASIDWEALKLEETKNV